VIDRETRRDLKVVLDVERIVRVSIGHMHWRVQTRCTDFANQEACKWRASQAVDTRTAGQIRKCGLCAAKRKRAVSPVSTEKIGHRPPVLATELESMGADHL